jgi:hypothetical protein
MTWQPGSIGSLRGHVQLCAKYIGVARGTGIPRLQYTQLMRLTSPCPYTLGELVGENLHGFHNVSGTVYYIGKSAVFETDMDSLSVLPVFFDPVALQSRADGSGSRPILFHKLHKLEWLFG